MKKLLTVGIIATLTLSVFGQGQITFNNRVTTATPNPVLSPVYLDAVGGTALNGTDTRFRIALLGGPTTGLPAFIPNSRTNSSGALVPGMGTLSLLASPSTGATWATFRTGALAGYAGVGTDTARD